jgi:hypothetical protein
MEAGLMANSRKERREKMDPKSMKQERQTGDMGMPYGNFPTRTNNTMNEEKLQSGRVYGNPYMDAQVPLAQAGDPMIAEYTGMPQNVPFSAAAGANGPLLNGMKPYGTQNQMPGASADPTTPSGASKLPAAMEANRLIGTGPANQAGLLAQEGYNQASAMGFIGAPNVIPGGVRPDNVANATTLSLQGGMNTKTGSRNA